MARLLTFADLDGDPEDTRQVCVSARLEAELVDGRRLVLLADRGWTASIHVFWQDGSPRPAESELPDIWTTTSLQDVEAEARRVVGPELAYGPYSQDEMDDGYWAYLGDALQRQGVRVEPEDLRHLSHDVVVSDRLRSRIVRPASL